VHKLDHQQKKVFIVKIATWNLNWPRPSSFRNAAILEALKKVDADILVLTETNDVITPGEAYKPLSSDVLPDPKPYNYVAGDHEVTIWSRHPMTQIKVSEASTSVCARVEIANKQLNVFGTVIGILGKASSSFPDDVAKQIADWRTVGGSLENVCIAGDFNMSWDSFYFTEVERRKISACLREQKIRNLTEGIPKNIDHIAVSESWLERMQVEVLQTWNDPPDKVISDHKGVCIKFGSRRPEANED
jgi:endonuclease/exonuclease/phosphatase family metal-dependent hydrolase